MWPELQETFSSDLVDFKASMRTWAIEGESSVAMRLGMILGLAAIVMADAGAQQLCSELRKV